MSTAKKFYELIMKKHVLYLIKRIAGECNLLTKERSLSTGALVQREKWLGGAVRSACLQRQRYVVRPDIAAETKEWQRLETRCAGYECDQRQSDHHCPHIRLFRRDGNSYVGSGGLVSVSTNAIIVCVCDKKEESIVINNIRQR